MEPPVTAAAGEYGTVVEIFCRVELSLNPEHAGLIISVSLNMMLNLDKLIMLPDKNSFQYSVLIEMCLCSAKSIKSSSRIPPTSFLKLS